MSGDIAVVIGGEFDGEGVEATSTFTLVPPGWYTAEIESAEVKKTKNGDGSYLRTVYCVVSDASKGRKLFKNVTLSNPNSKAVEIGMRDLEALRQACSLRTISDSSDIIGKIVDVKVTVKKGDNGYEDDNDIKGWRSPNGSPKQATKPAEAQERPTEKKADKPVAGGKAARQRPTGKKADKPVAGGKAARPWER